MDIDRNPFRKYKDHSIPSPSQLVNDSMQRSRRPKILGISIFESRADSRNEHRQELLTRLEEITEEIIELDDAYAEKHRKFEVCAVLTLLIVEQDSRILDHVLRRLSFTDKTLDEAGLREARYRKFKLLLPYHDLCSAQTKVMFRLKHISPER